MIQKLFLVWSILFVFFDCFGKKKDPQPFYVKNILGISLDSDLSIPFREKVLVLFDPNVAEDSARIKYLDKEYLVYKKYLSEYEPKQYFLVTESQGLNLREGPGTNFKKLKTLPKGTSGEILKATAKLEKIQKQTGYWFFTEYQGLKGWLFSGFVITSDTQDRLGSDTFSNFKSESSGDFGFQSISLLEDFSEGGGEKTYMESESVSFAGYKVGLLKENNSDDYSAGCGFENSIKITGNGKEVHLQGGSFQIKNKSSIEKGFIFYSSNGCGCCCAPSKNYLVVLDKSEIVYTSYTSYSDKASCSTMEMEFLIEYQGMEFRIDSEKPYIYLRRESPICDPEPVPSESGGNKFEQTGSNYSFHIFKNENGKFSEESIELKNREIPSAWKESWDSATKLED